MERGRRPRKELVLQQPFFIRQAEKGQRVEKGGYTIHRIGGRGGGRGKGQFSLPAPFDFRAFFFHPFFLRLKNSSPTHCSQPSKRRELQTPLPLDQKVW